MCRFLPRNLSSLMARTTKDWPMCMSPAVNMPGIDVEWASLENCAPESVDNIRLRSVKPTAIRTRSAGIIFSEPGIWCGARRPVTGSYTNSTPTVSIAFNFAAVRYESLDGGVIYPRIVAEYRNSFLLAVIRFQNSQPFRPRISGRA